MSVVSIDLAARRYDDIGIAILDGLPNDLRIELIPPSSRSLAGKPDARTLAKLAVELATESEATLILLDGPQGWRSDNSSFEHQRVCEKCTSTPGKTGPPGVVKPATWTRMAEFSILVFDALENAGWPRFDGTWPLERAAVETFPTHAWRALGFHPVPGKSKSRSAALEPWHRLLSDCFGVRWSALPTHDELQAAVAGLGGIALQHYGLDGCLLHGRQPFRETDVWREGFIVSPRPPLLMPCHPLTARRGMGSNCYCRPPRFST